MLEKFLKDNFEITSSDKICSQCGGEAPGTVLELLEAAKRTETEQLIINKLEALVKCNKQKVLFYLGGLLNGFKKDGQV